LKIRFGSAYPRKDEILMDVKGRSLGGGLPLALQLGSNEITYALSEPLRSIVEELKDALEQTPAELCGDIT
jgi:rod shape-determining protein MreB